jgi:hypothetical protein
MKDNTQRVHNPQKKYNQVMYKTDIKKKGWLLLLMPIFLLSGFVVQAQTITEASSLNSDFGQCKLIFSSQSNLTEVDVLDLDNSGKEIISLQLPKVKTEGNCGKVEIIQTAGPKKEMLLPLGDYTIDYTAMAVDKSTLEVVAIKRAFLVHIKSTDN